MPKGTKIVDWTPENEAKLFHTIMAVHDIKVDNAKVAEAFGPDVPASCIVTKMSTLRKKAAAMGVIMSPTPSTNTARATATGKGKNKKSDGDATTAGAEEQNTKEDAGSGQGATPPESPDEKVAAAPGKDKTKDKVLNGKVKKPRAPRKTPAKKAVKKISDPFVEEDDAKDDNGGILSGNDDNAMEDANAQIAPETEEVKHEEA